MYMMKDFRRRFRQIESSDKKGWLRAEPEPSLMNVICMKLFHVRYDRAVIVDEDDKCIVIPCPERRHYESIVPELLVPVVQSVMPTLSSVRLLGLRVIVTVDLTPGVN